MHFFSWSYRACQMNFSISVKPIFINSSGIEIILISFSKKLKRIVRGKFRAPLLTPPNFINSSNFRFLRLKLCLNFFQNFIRDETFSESSGKLQKVIPIVSMQNYTILQNFTAANFRLCKFAQSDFRALGHFRRRRVKDVYLIYLCLRSCFYTGHCGRVV